MATRGQHGDRDGISARATGAGDAAHVAGALDATGKAEAASATHAATAAAAPGAGPPPSAAPGQQRLGWTEVRVVVPLGWQELVGETLALGPCSSVAFGRPNLAAAAAPPGCDYVRTFVSSSDDTPALRARIRAVLHALPESTGADELRGLDPLFRELPWEDYANSWKKVWRPFRVGRLCVLAPWSSSRPRPGERVMRLVPGGAFGSGRHPTTRMLLRAIEQRLRPGERLLDAGSGSGILAVAAALAGAREAFGFDNDPSAQPYAEQLAADNGVERICRFATGGFELLGRERQPFDAVLANIYSDVLQAHAADLCRALRPGGWFALGGCPDRHAAETAAALARAGLELQEQPVRGRWHGFVGQRPGR